MKKKHVTLNTSTGILTSVSFHVSAKVTQLREISLTKETIIAGEFHGEQWLRADCWVRRIL